MPSHIRSRVLALVACVAVWSCGGGYVSRGRNLYYEGRYIESAEVLARHERELVQEDASRRAEYATFRGLSLLVLGDYPSAHRWMSYAYTIEQAAPGSLRREHRMELDRGWRELRGRMSVQPLPVPPPPGGPVGWR